MSTIDLDVWNRLRRLGVRLATGPRAGVNVRLRSLLRFLAWRGDKAGHRAEGRLRDYLFVQSALTNRTLYRRREISPLRRLHMVVDTRDFQAGPSQRLLQGAELIGGILLAMPGTRVSLSAWGTRDFFPLQFFNGAGQWPWLCDIVRKLASLASDARAPTGALQRAAAADEAAHTVLVSSWIEPCHILGLPAPLGGTCFLIEPQRSWLGSAVGTADPLLSLQPLTAADDRDAQRFNELGNACEHRRFDLLFVPGTGPILDALESVLGN